MEIQTYRQIEILHLYLLFSNAKACSVPERERETERERKTDRQRKDILNISVFTDL